MSELTPHEIASLVELGEARAWMDYFACAPAAFAAACRVVVKHVGSACVTMIPQLDMRFFNRINLLGVNEPATESQVAEGIELVECAGCTNYMVQLSPLAQPPELVGWLAARGLRKANNWAKMYRGNEPALGAHTDLRIQPIGREYTDAFGEIALTAFEMPLELRPHMACVIGKPGWYHYMAFDGRHPVAGAAMYVLNDVAWLGFGCTLEAYRGRGAQSALFACRIEDGLGHGVRWFVTETGEDRPEQPNPSYRNMLRAGFKLAYMRPNYVHGA